MTILLLLIFISFLYLVIAYQYMYSYVVEDHPTVTFPPSKFVLTNPNANGKLVCVVLGDSSSAGQGAQSPTESYSYQYLANYLLPQYQEITLHNLATSGATTADVLRHQVEPTIALYPDLVMLAVGGNDLIQGCSRQQFIDNYRQILTKLQILNVPIIALNIPAFNCTPILLEPIRSLLHWRSHYFNVGLAQLATEFPLVKIVDIYAVDLDIIFSPDRFHLSGTGYSLWAKQIANTLKADFAPNDSHSNPRA